MVGAEIGAPRVTAATHLPGGRGCMTGSNIRSGNLMLDANGQVCSGQIRYRSTLMGIAGLLAGVALTGCSGQGQRSASWHQTSIEHAPVPALPVAAAPFARSSANTPEGSVPKVKGVYKVGKPYVINGVTYTPAEDPSYDRVGIASWYGTDFHAKQTANGERFDMHAISAAHPTLPMPSYLYVTNIRNGRTLLVRLNDRGPYKSGRIVDLSRHSAQLLGFEAQGTTEIRVRYAGPAPIDPSDTRRERQHLASQPWSRSVRTASGSPPPPPYGLGMSRPATP